MSTAAAHPDHGPEPHGHDSHDAHAHHPPFLAHHFDSPEQQFASAKLGMWVFLGTEILMFGGLFCAYAVYRNNHPEIFLFSAEKYLDTMLGAINTCVLIASSFTMAWAVRLVQINKSKAAVLCLLATFLGGLGFMCIKYVEYKSKWEHHVFVGPWNNMYSKVFPGDPTLKLQAHDAHGAPGAAADPAHDAAAPKTEYGATGEHSPGASVHAEHSKPDAAAHPASQPALVARPYRFADPHAGTADAAKFLPSFAAPAGMVEPAAPEGRHHAPAYSQLRKLDQDRVATFFSIYFIMTGLHGLHVLVGMGLIAWVTLKTMGGIFSAAYFTPVEIVGLYWHLVDLIWIFLFPLLYLIH